MNDTERPGPKNRLFLLAIAAIGLTGLAVAAIAQEGAPPDVKPPARIAVSPGKLEVSIGAQPVVESLKLINFGDTPVDIRVSVVPWDLDENSRVRILEPTEQSLDQWMLINPRAFTVAEESEQTVRFSIRPRTRPEDGEHRAMIYFEEVPRDPVEGQAVQVRFKLGVAVYAYAGEVRRVGELAGVQVAADPQLLSAAFDIDAPGNAHVRMQGQYAIWPAEAFPGLEAITLFEGLDNPDFQPEGSVLRVGNLPNTPVLGGTRRQLPLVGGHGLPSGLYVLSALGSLGESEFREQVEFFVPPAPETVSSGQQEPSRN